MSSRSKTTESPKADARQEETTLIGRLTADPQLHHTTSGKPVTTIRIAVNNGTEATFHSVVVWRKTAEAVCQYLKKGRMVEVTGYPQQRSYTAADGTQRIVTETIARRVQFVSTSKTASATSAKEVA